MSGRVYNSKLDTRFSGNEKPLARLAAEQGVIGIYL